MAGTARKAGALYGVLHALSSGTTPSVDLGIDAVRLAGRPAREIVDRIAEALSPIDGTQDSEASRNSISQALCELIRREPTADLTALTREQIELSLELFISADIFRRIELDVGKTVFDGAPDPVTAIRRLGEMDRYARQAVAASFRRQPANSGSFTQQAATRLASRVIQNTFEIFESYLSGESDVFKIQPPLSLQRALYSRYSNNPNTMAWDGSLLQCPKIYAELVFCLLRKPGTFWP